MPEPRWIAYELHDGLMQWVIGARMHMAGLVAAMKEGRPIDDLEGTLTQVLSYLNQATEDGRQLIRFIEGLDERETVDVVAVLETTCEILTRKARDGKPRLEFYGPAEPWPELEPEKAWPIVRITQQAVFNAIRHSGAESVKICLRTAANQLVIEVQDDGTGFDPDASYPGHFGLRTMRQRAQEAGIALQISSGSTGSTIKLTI